MSPLSSLPPDLSATLSLVLRQRKRYAEVAAMLGIQERAVHDRAHAALAVLAPGQARALDAAQRERVGEYLLGQQSETAQRETRTYLASDPAAHAWAAALTDELQPLAAQPLPSIPAPQSHEPQLASSRAGGAIVLGAIAAAIVVAVLLIVGVGGGGGSAHTTSNPSASSGSQTPSSHDGTSTSGNSTSTSSSGTNGNTSTDGSSSANGASSTSGASQTSHGKALTLTPPSPATSKAVGVAYVLTQKGRHAFYLFAKGLPTLASGAFYAVWLEGAASAPAYPLGSLPSPAANGLIEGGGPLPSSAGDYRRILVTTETSHHPTTPGPTVLRGAFSLQ
ncbi:MAG TPA: hypothetical protein VGI76_06045 [Solirubrobacteraceae bacterium]|jgi:hypothetical protein